MEDWLAQTLAGAGLALLGYFGKVLLDRLRARAAEKKARDSALFDLSDLLEESNSIFRDQNYKRDRLASLLHQNHPEEAKNIKGGYDELFFQLYDHFNDEEKELQALIRGTTIHSMRRVNKELLSWLDSNKQFLRTNKKDVDFGGLAIQLKLLKEHLNQWFDKYDVWVKEEKRTLVYLADEKGHGTGFPHNLEPLLASIIKKIS